MAKHDIIVVGASAGGVTALVHLVKSLPPDFKGSMFIVLHIPVYQTSALPSILSAAGPLEAVHPQDGEAFAEGKIYVSPNNHHLLLTDEKIAVKKGPAQNRFIPSIDALFCSAAYIYSERVVGIILSGALNDGVYGLWTIQRMGGIAIIQSTHDAIHPDLPENALQFIKPDYEVRSSDMGSILSNLNKNISIPGAVKQVCSPG